MTYGPGSAIVTGAGGGIGLQVATDLSAEGVAVLAVDLKPRPGELPEACSYQQLDVSDPDAADRAVAVARDELGGVGMLVNAAGVGWFGRDTSILDMELELWDRVLDINLGGAMRFARAVGTEMRRNGSGVMVHVASIAGIRGMDDPMDAYQVSKASVISLSRALAVQLGPLGIRSNTVCPGAILTPMVSGIYAEDPSRKERMAGRTPLRRLGTPSDISAACRFLLSDSASFITGIDLVVDGGWLAVTP
jgi:NAD(P)-dependent dehydrogenase (short-subunit alcohol dehydrogenase family)